MRQTFWALGKRVALWNQLLKQARGQEPGSLIYLDRMMTPAHRPGASLAVRF